MAGRGTEAGNARSSSGTSSDRYSTVPPTAPESEGNLPNLSGRTKPWKPDFHPTCHDRRS